MDGSSAKKSTSLESLVIQNISNVNDLKAKLNDIINTGKNYEYDVSTCLKTLLHSNDHDIVILCIQAVSELAKCAEKRKTFAHKEIIEPIIEITRKECTSDKTELLKQCCRALGNLCCDCDMSRKIILESNGVPVLVNLLKYALDKGNSFEEVKIFACKMFQNFAIGGPEFSEPIVEGGLLELIKKVLDLELQRDDMNDDTVSTALLVLSVVHDNTPDYLFDEGVNKTVINVLKEAANVDISELCLDHLLMQAEHDTVKTLVAEEKLLESVCHRLEHVMQSFEGTGMGTADPDVVAVMKQACDLIVIVLTGDDAMRILYNKGYGEVYLKMIEWLGAKDYDMLTTAILAIGNFARQDDYCTSMMKGNLFDRLLDIFEEYNNYAINVHQNPDGIYPVDKVTVTRIQHAVLAALRNLTVPVANKKMAAAEGRAAPLYLSALPHIEDHQVAYKLLAAIRMLVDGQEDVARQLAERPAALRAAARWGRAAECAGAAGEAPRLLAWAVRQLRHSHWKHILQAEGCITSLVNMLVSSHSVMQNEAILALTLLAIASLNKTTPQTEEPESDYEKSFIAQLIESEIGKHVSVLIETNCAKMPVEVAENLLAFLDITSKKNKIAMDYKEAKLHESLQKFKDSRKDLSENLKSCITEVIIAISDSAKTD